MGARSRSTDLASHYGELLEEQERSGLSVTEFAAECGVSAGTLYSWRRRLLGPGAQAQLVEVSLVQDAPGARGSSGLTLQIDDRFVIELPTDFDAMALERLLGVLGRC